MINVLFVCLGNICRSPMAEGVFRDLLKKKICLAKSALIQLLQVPGILALHRTKEHLQSLKNTTFQQTV